MGKNTLKTQPVMTAQTAEAILADVFEACGVEPNTVPMEALSAYTVYRRERFHLQRGVIVAMLTLFFLLPFLFVRASLEVEGRDQGDRRLPVYTVRVNSFLPVQSVRAQVKNRNLPVYEQDGKTYTIEPTRNGKLQISVALVNWQETGTSVEVDGVDKKGPAYVGSEVTGDKVHLYVEDEGIGVDFDNAYALSASGERILPHSTDPENGTIIFDYPEETWDVYIPDHIGNVLHLAMKFA